MITLLGTEGVVAAVTIGREGVGELQLTVMDGNLNGSRVNIGFNIGKSSFQRNDVYSRFRESVLGVILIAYHHILRLVFLTEVPFEGYNMVFDVFSSGMEGNVKRSVRREVLLGFDD